MGVGAQASARCVRYEAYGFPRMKVVLGILLVVVFLASAVSLVGGALMKYTLTEGVVVETILKPRGPFCSSPVSWASSYF